MAAKNPSSPAVAERSLDEKRISVSPVVEFKPARAGTRSLPDNLDAALKRAS